MHRDSALYVVTPQTALSRPLPLGKESVLNFGQMYRKTAFFVVIRHGIDPSLTGRTISRASYGVSGLDLVLGSFPQKLNAPVTLR
jgi:hypothetical protein